VVRAVWRVDCVLMSGFALTAAESIAIANDAARLESLVASYGVPETPEVITPIAREPARNATKEPARGPRAKRAAPSLDRGTHDDRDLAGVDWKGRPRYRCTLMDFGHGVVEVSAVWMNGPSRRPASPSRGDVARVVDAVTARERAQRSVRRSKQSMRRRVLMLHADRMLTLTKRGKFSSLDECWAAWARFERVCSRFYRQKWKYVVVPELHADGETYHLHVALSGFYDVGMLRRFWYRALGGSGRERGTDTPGNVDLSYDAARRGSRSRIRIAGYLAKYLGKGLAARARGRRTFAASAGLVPVAVQRWSEPVYVGRRAAGVIAERLRASHRGVSVRIFEWREAGLTGFTVKTY
jgi:hypothetical protein